MQCSELTEIVGSHSSGKTSLALFFVNDKPTLYISCTLFRHKTIPPYFTIMRLPSFLNLKILLTSKIPFLASFRFIIIDGLEEFLYTVEQRKIYSAEISRITKIFKRLVFKYNTNVIVTNYFYENNKCFGKIPYNPYLGYNWAYAPNNIFIVTKKNDKHEINKILGISKVQAFFKITSAGVEFL